MAPATHATDNPALTGGAARSGSSCREVEQNDHPRPRAVSNVVPASNAVSSVSCREPLAGAIGVVVRSVGVGRSGGAELDGQKPLGGPGSRTVVGIGTIHIGSVYVWRCDLPPVS